MHTQLVLHFVVFFLVEYAIFFVSAWLWPSFAFRFVFAAMPLPASGDHFVDVIRALGVKSGDIELDGDLSGKPVFPSRG